jgi:hypothetical protein
MMAYSEDHIALAAEYALGTLDADERVQVEAMMSVDKDFTAMVEAWQHKLAALNQMVGSVEPRPFVWDNIRIAVGHAEPQAPMLLPQATSPAAASVVAEPAAAAGCVCRGRTGRRRRHLQCHPNVRADPALAQHCFVRHRAGGGAGRHDRDSGVSAGSAA